MSGAGKYGIPCIGLLAAMLLLAPNAAHAEARHAGSTALLAISFDEGRVAAGMMCVGAGFAGIDHSGPSDSEKFEAPESNMCRRPSVLNPNVLAFDVTSWPRWAIADLAERLRLMADPLNYDFSKARVAERHVRRVEETADEEGLSPPAFEFSSGCYLLMVSPGAAFAPGS